MAVLTNSPTTVPAVTTEEKVYDTIVVLETRSRLDASTMTMEYNARVGLGKATATGYEILKSSIKNINIDNLFATGTEDEIALSMAVADTLKLRYETESR